MKSVAAVYILISRVVFGVIPVGTTLHTLRALRGDYGDITKQEAHYEENSDDLHLQTF